MRERSPRPGWIVVLLAAVTLLAGRVADAQAPARLPLPLEPLGASGEAVFPVFEGWTEAPDGSGYYLVLGYKNRNRVAVDIPVGPNNRFEPDVVDRGQPTHFLAGRQKTQFAIKVPKDFGQKRLTWTIVAHGQTATTTFYLNPLYALTVYREEANGNEPPRLTFAPGAPPIVGPTVGFAQTATATVGTPVPLRLWAADLPPSEKNWENIVSAQNRPKAVAPDRDQVAIVGDTVVNVARANRGAADPPADITAVWTKFRGPGTVTVQPPNGVPLRTQGNPATFVEASAVATFSAPGEYWLRAEPVEIDDGFDGLCCVTFALLKVTVK